MSKNNDEKFQIRITDKGAVHAVLPILNTLILLATILRFKKITTTKELIKELKGQLRKTLHWLERIPDATLYGELSKKQINVIKKEARTVLAWKMIPTDSEYKKRERNIKEWEALQNEEEQRMQNRLQVMTDTSFLLSYLSENDNNAESAKVIISYLKTQRKYFDLYLPNLVLLELVSKLKQQYSFTNARTRFENLLTEISDKRLIVKEQKMGLFDIFERYQKFSKQKLSSSLKSNDFIIATDGIISNALILTCDKKMYQGIKKTYKAVFLVDTSTNSYTNFINQFEKFKNNLLKTNNPAS